MVFLPAVITALATAMGFGNLERFVLFTMYATPVATASYSMAQNMGGDGELAGQFVVISTAVSIVTIFLWVLFFKTMGMILGKERILGGCFRDSAGRPCRRPQTALPPHLCRAVQGATAHPAGRDALCAPQPLQLCQRRGRR